MIRGIYASAAALASHSARQELLASNLANATTLGYRGLRACATGYPALLRAADDSAGSWPKAGLRAAPGQLSATGAPDLWGPGCTVSAASLDPSPGPLETTGNPLDLALVGDGLFVCQTPRGVRYTRAGRFQLDTGGRLVTPSGYAVLGARGPIVLPPGEVQVREDGQVSVDGRPVDRLRLVTFPDGAQLVPEGQGYLSCSGPEQPAAGLRVVQGAVEHSNVMPATELSRMIQGLRLYEANISAMRAQDQSLARLLSAIQ